MLRLFTILSALLIWTVGVCQNEQPRASLSLDVPTAKPGEAVRGVVTITFAPGLHGYQNPPSESYMIPVEVNAGNKSTVLASVAYPRGELLAVGGSEEPVAVYGGATKIPVTFTAPATAGSHELRVSIHYQQCDDVACYAPSTVEASATLVVQATATVAPEDPPKVAGPTVDQFELAQPADAQGKAKVRWRTSGATRAEIKFQGKTIKLSGASGTTEITVTANGSATLTALGPDGQKATQSLELKVAAVAEPTDQQPSLEPQPTNPAPTTTEPPQAGAPLQPDADTETGNWAIRSFTTAFKAGNYATVVLIALLFGLALALTPCVYPMIPITASYFANQTASNRAGRIGLGAMYTLGIAATYGVLGGIMAGLGNAVGDLFTRPWFLVLLGAILIGLALSMFDVYEIRLPGFISRNLKSRSGPIGALIMGLLMGFAAAPCAGPFVIAAAAPVAEAKSIPMGLLVFSSIGLGLGLPFMVLAAGVTGAKSLPRSGGWLKTVKAVLGLIVIYLAIGYLFQAFGLRPDQAQTQVAWLVVLAGFAVYLLVFEHGDTSRFGTILKGAAVLGLGLMMGTTWSKMSAIRFEEALQRAGGAASSRSIQWIPWTEASYEEAKKSGKPIMIDGAADWCVKCHEIENKVFKTPEGLVALSNVVTMRIDWSTGVDQKYVSETAKRFKIVGLPHIVFAKPGGEDEFAVFELASVEDLKRHLRRAGANL